MPDTDWAPLARSSRKALAELGYEISPQCLPDEPDKCGGSFAGHAVAQLAALHAVADHHLAHLAPHQEMVIRPYDETAKALAAECSDKHLYMTWR